MKIYEKLFIGKLAREIKNSVINHPDEWENSFYAIRHKESGMEVMCETSIRIRKGQSFSILEEIYLRDCVIKLKNTFKENREGYLKANNFLNKEVN